MRGSDNQQSELFSYGRTEERIPEKHPLRAIRAMVDEALKDMNDRFNRIYGDDGRPSIAPERLLRALLLQMLYSVRSERMLMEQLSYNLLFRWFVGLSENDAVWHVRQHLSGRFKRALHVAELLACSSCQRSVEVRPHL
jgi:transposase